MAASRRDETLQNRSRPERPELTVLSARGTQGPATQGLTRLSGPDSPGQRIAAQAAGPCRGLCGSPRWEAGPRLGKVRPGCSGGSIGARRPGSARPLRPAGRSPPAVAAAMQGLRGGPRGLDAQHVPVRLWVEAGAVASGSTHTGPSEATTTSPQSEPPSGEARDGGERREEEKQEAPCGAEQGAPAARGQTGGLRVGA